MKSGSRFCDDLPQGFARDVSFFLDNQRGGVIFAEELQVETPVYVKLKQTILDADPYPNLLNLIYCATGVSQDLMTVSAPPLSSIIAIIIAVMALLVSAFVSGSETAFFSLTPTTIDEIENETKRERIRHLVGNPERLLATILIANNFVNVTIVLLLNFAMNQFLQFNSAVWNFLFQSVILTFILLLFGEILPKLYTNDRNLKWALFACGGLTFLTRLFSPLSSLMTKSTVIVNKIITKKADRLSLDDLSHALEITAVDEVKDKNMLEEILKFGGKTVSDIMTSRVDITAVDRKCSFEELLDIVRESGYSRLPVYEENQDNIRGIVYAKDLLPHIGRKEDSFRWQTLLREPFFVPESRMIDDILEDFQKKKMHMAIVVDEYGGTQGLVTLEDVLEEIVGEINDEYDDDEKHYTRLSHDTYLFEGKTLLNDFYRVTGIDEDEFSGIDEDADTIAGLLLNVKHDFPKEKEVIEYGRCRFLVVSIDRHRIDKVKVRIVGNSPA